MDYLKLLEHSYSVAVEQDECPPDSRLEWLGEQVFDFTTYDGEMSALLASRRQGLKLRATVRAARTRRGVSSSMRTAQGAFWGLSRLVGWCGFGCAVGRDVRPAAQSLSLSRQRK